MKVVNIKRAKRLHDSSTCRSIYHLRNQAEDFSYLTETHSLNEEPKWVSLPQLPVHSPKGFERSWNSGEKNFLLTAERQRILKEVAAFAKSDVPSGGLLPVGPPGIGKSALTSLLASYAYLNGHPLVYVV